MAVVSRQPARTEGLYRSASILGMKASTLKLNSGLFSRQRTAHSDA